MAPKRLTGSILITARTTGLCASPRTSARFGAQVRQGFGTVAGLEGLEYELCPAASTAVNT